MHALSQPARPPYPPPPPFSLPCPASEQHCNTTAAVRSCGWWAVVLFCTKPFFLRDNDPLAASIFRRGMPIFRHRQQGDAREERWIPHLQGAPGPQVRHHHGSRQREVVLQPARYRARSPGESEYENATCCGKTQHVLSGCCVHPSPLDDQRSGAIFPVHNNTTTNSRSCRRICSLI